MFVIPGLYGVCLSVFETVHVCAHLLKICTTEACRLLGCMEIRRNTTEKQVMEETGEEWGEGRRKVRKEGRKEGEVVDGSRIIRSVMRRMENHKKMYLRNGGK